MLRPLALLGLLLVSTALHALTPGQWENQINPEMVGVPIPFPAYSVTYCVDAAHPAPKIDQAGRVCSESQVQESGTTLTWQVNCSSEQESVKGSGKATFSADSVSGDVAVEVTNASGEVTPMVYHFSGKRLGDCH